MKELNEMVRRWKEDFEDIIDPEDRFVEHMEVFLKKGNPELRKLKMHFGNAKTSQKRLRKYFSFGTDDHPERVEELFKIFHRFMQELDVTLAGAIFCFGALKKHIYVHF